MDVSSGERFAAYVQRLSDQAVSRSKSLPKMVRLSTIRRECLFIANEHLGLVATADELTAYARALFDFIVADEYVHISELEAVVKDGSGIRS